MGKTKKQNAPELLKSLSKLAFAGFSEAQAARILKIRSLNLDQRNSFLDGQIARKRRKITTGDSDEAKRKRTVRKQLNELIVPIPIAEQIERRKKLEAAGLEAWMLVIFPGWFPLPFSEAHRDLIRTCERVIVGGGLEVEAMPRGSGKTTIFKAAAIFAMATGRRKFIVPVLARADLAVSFTDDIKKQFLDNTILAELYPEMCAGPRMSENNAQRAKMIQFKGKTGNFVWSRNEIILPQIDAFPWSGAIIKPVSVTASFRGLQRSVFGKDGEAHIVRPDMVIIDDPQTKESAKSEQQTREREDIISEDILGLAGPNKKISCVMSCTVIRKDDLADRILDKKLHPEWAGHRVKMVLTWPAEQDGLWQEYCAMRRREIEMEVDHSGSTEFYRVNRVKMDAGAQVYWEHRKNPEQLSAIQHVEDLLADIGADAFASEYQNEPRSRQFQLYDLSSRLVESRVNHLARYVLDPDVRLITAFTDINFSGLHWAVVGFKNDRTGFLLDYGRLPERGVLIQANANITEQKKEIAEGLVKFVGSMDGIKLERVQIRVLGIDRGFHPETVHQVARRIRARFPIMPCKGFGGTQYRPNPKGIVGKPGIQCHISESQFGQFFAANTDYFKEQVQRALLSAPAVPGSLSIYGKDGRRHAELAEHLCAEVLTDKAEGKYGTFWKWSLKPGAVNDWLDAVAGCYGLASWYLGDGSGQEQGQSGRPRTRTRPKLRKPKIQIEE